MTYGALLPIASLATTLAGAALLLFAVATAALSIHFFRRARSRETLAPARQTESAQSTSDQSTSEMRLLGDRIETLVNQQQLQGETQRQRLGQQIDEVRQVVSQQGHRMDGLRGEFQHEMQKRDHEIGEIRQQLSAIQQAALPAAETEALPPAPRALPPAAAPEPTDAPALLAEAPEAAPVAEPAFTFEPGGDSFAGAEAPPPRPPESAAEPANPAPARDLFEDALSLDAPLPAIADSFFGQPPDTPEPAEPTPAEPFPPASVPAPPPPGPSAFESPVFSDMGFDAFAPGEPASAGPEDTSVSWEVTPAPADGFTDAAPAAPPPSAVPPDGGAWVIAQRETPAAAPPAATPPAEVSPADEWAEAMPAEAAAPYVPPADADDFRFISTITEDVQRTLHMAGVTKLEEIAHWSRGDARRIATEVGVSEETIMNQWVFEAQGALFERYSSHVGG